MRNLLTNSGNRILSLIVVAAITLSVLPISAMARDNDADAGTSGASGCVCEVLCGEDSINADCPVCGGDYEQCAYTAATVASPGDTGNEDGGGLKLAGDGESCVCETLCGAETPNTECPVCKDDYTKCAQTPLPALAAAATVTVNGTEVTIDSLEAGTLQAKIESIVNDNTNYPDITAPGQITKLTVTGTMNSDDLNYIWEGAYWSGSGALTGLTALDLSGVTGLTLSTYQFAFHTKLQSVALPDSLTSIGDSAFSGCASLQRVGLPDSLVSIEPFALPRAAKSDA